jgi:hypothetical protein
VRLVQDGYLSWLLEPEPELLHAQIGRGNYLDGVVMNVRGDAPAFFLLCPDEVTKKQLPIPVLGDEPSEGTAAVAVI